jgi:predicted exporter
MALRKPIFHARLIPFLWTAGVCAFSAWLILSVPAGTIINADLMALLPATEQDPIVQAATTKVEKRFERRVVMLVGAEDFEAAKSAAQYVVRQLSGSEQFHSLNMDRNQGTVRRAISFYLPLRFHLLADDMRILLKDGNVTAFESIILKRYFNPRSPISSKLIENDPLLLLPRFLERHGAKLRGRHQLKDGYVVITTERKIFILILGELASSPFSFSMYQELMPIVDDLRTRLPEKFPGSEFLLAGALPHAAAGTKSAFEEVSTVGFGSIVGIIALFYWVFRSARPMVLAGLSIGLGCLAGLAAHIAIFGQIHMLTLVFGASLVGISVDYSLHYFCERFRFTADWSPQSALRQIMPGITLGLATSVIGFVGLFIAPFPGMQGMAVFSSVGLCVAYGSVVICYPKFTQNLPRPGYQKPLAWMRGYGMVWQRRFNWRAWSSAVILTVFSVLGVLRLSANDDIRLLQTPDAHVSAEEKQVQNIIGNIPASQYYLVEGRDDAEFLERAEYLANQLAPLQERGQLKSIVTLSDFIPSPQRQAENHQLLTPLILGKGYGLDRIAKQIGLPEASRSAYVDAFTSANHAQPVLLSKWLADPVSKPYRHLWLGRTTRGVIGVIGLFGVTNISALQSLANEQQYIHFVDPPGEISDLFRSYRRQTIWLTLISYGVVLLLLLMRYGIIGGLLVMAPPAIAAIVSLGTLGWLGEPINLFNVMAMLLVLGIGIDYSIFFRETGTDNPSTLLAIALSSITTLLAFGLLTLSETTAIHSFGLTILIGICAAFILSPVAGWKIRR